MQSVLNITKGLCPSNTRKLTKGKAVWRRSAVTTVLLCLLVGQVAAQNILNNSGFESGLMCWGYYTWSYSYQTFAGDYVYGLSTDSHSGNYSFSIACKPSGTDCWRAALISGNIPSPPG